MRVKKRLRFFSLSLSFKGESEFCSSPSCFTEKLTCVIHQDVDRLAAESVQGGPNAFGGELRIRDVAGKRRRFPRAAGSIDLRGDALGFLAVEVGDEDAGPMRGEEAGGGRSEALAGAGDDGDLD